MDFLQIFQDGHFGAIFGAIIGGIISGVAAIITAVVTLKNTAKDIQEQAKEEREKERELLRQQLDLDRKNVLFSLLTECKENLALLKTTNFGPLGFKFNTEAWELNKGNVHSLPEALQTILLSTYAAINKHNLVIDYDINAILMKSGDIFATQKMNGKSAIENSLKALLQELETSVKSEKW